MPRWQQSGPLRQQWFKFSRRTRRRIGDVALDRRLLCSGGNVLGGVANKAGAEPSGFRRRQGRYEAGLGSADAGSLGHDRDRAKFVPGGAQLGRPSRSRHARATAAITVNEAYAPSASPFSKSPLLTAIWLVTCARQSTGFCRAWAKA